MTDGGIKGMGRRGGGGEGERERTAEPPNQIKFSSACSESTGGLGE